MIAQMTQIVQSVLGGDAASPSLSWAQVAARAVCVYLAGLVIIRLGKSRLLSRATPLDVILAFIIGSVLSRGINGSATLSGTIVATATLVAIHWGFTRLACQSHHFGLLIK